jgi:hypothetical protein
MGFNYLCKDCWDIWKDHISEPWLRVLMSFEQKERAHDVNYQTQISLEGLQEIEYND